MYIFKTYRKAVEVINSCEDLQQLNVARSYVSFWYKAHAKDSTSYNMDSVLESLHKNLNNFLYIKKHKIIRDE